MECLGLRVVTQAFIVPPRNVKALSELSENILGYKKYTNVKTLQRFHGKCISLFIREMNHASANDNGRGSLSSIEGGAVLLAVLRLLAKLFSLEEKHVPLSLFTDASGFAWGCVFHLQGGSQSCHDFWNNQERVLDISSKETLASVNAFKALPTGIRDYSLML